MKTPTDTLVPSRELLRSGGPHAYILALAASFPCLADKVANWKGPFDADEWMAAAGPWSSGEKKAALFVVNVWNPGYAAKQGWTFDLFDACDSWDTGNRSAALNWIADPVWP